MNDLNIVAQNSRLVQDAELHDGSIYIKVANNRRYKDENAEHGYSSSTSFITWRLTGKRAESSNVLESLKKGTLVSLTGRQETYNNPYFIKDGDGFKEVQVPQTVNHVNEFKIVLKAPSKEAA